MERLMLSLMLIISDEYHNKVSVFSSGNTRLDITKSSLSKTIPSHPPPPPPPTHTARRDDPPTISPDTKNIPFRHCFIVHLNSKPDDDDEDDDDDDDDEEEEGLYNISNTKRTYLHQGTSPPGSVTGVSGSAGVWRSGRDKRSLTPGDQHPLSTADLPMTEDIVKLAALRQQRRPKTGRSGETTLFNPKNSTSTEETTETDDQLGATAVSLESPRSRGTRRRLSGESDFDDVIGSYESKIPLPFVNCKVSDVDVKALLSTSSKQSLISREMYSKMRSAGSDSRRQLLRAVLTFGTKQLALNLEVQDDIPDIVLGIDFLSQFKLYDGGLLIIESGPDNPVTGKHRFLKTYSLPGSSQCELNFRDSAIIMGRDDDVKLPFLPETEIPLKFRVHRNVAASF